MSDIYPSMKRVGGTERLALLEVTDSAGQWEMYGDSCKQDKEDMHAILNLYSAGDVLEMRRAGQKQSAGLSRDFSAPELVHKSIISSIHEMFE